MRRISFVAIALIICLVAWIPLARAASPLERSAASCTAKGNVSFMFWGDKGEDIEQTAVI